MIKIENAEMVGFMPAVRGMRNPLNSWDRSDSSFRTWSGDYIYLNGGPSGVVIDSDECGPEAVLGEKDLDLMTRLVKGGSTHAKFRRMLVVYLDITAPLYWWKEFDTYKVGTVANSCSTMHKIADKEFTREDFSCEHLIFDEDAPEEEYAAADMIGDSSGWEAVNDKYCGIDDFDIFDRNVFPGDVFDSTIMFLNRARDLYLKTKDKKYWWQMIQLLPSSYNQKRTIMLNYEVLAAMYKDRKDHKLDEWRGIYKWVGELSYAKDLIV